MTLARNRPELLRGAWARWATVLDAETAWIPHGLMSHVTAQEWTEMRGYQHVICNDYEAWPFFGYVNE